MKTEPIVTLEIPVNRRDASRRGFVTPRARLILGFEESEFWSTLERLLEHLLPPGSAIVIEIENEFRPLRLALRDAEVSTLATGPAVALPTPTDCVRLLQHWPCEAAVLYFVEGADAVKNQGRVKNRDYLWQVAAESRHRRTGPVTTDIFVFLAHLHPSVEIIGSPATVLSALGIVRSEGIIPTYA